MASQAELLLDAYREGGGRADTYYEEFGGAAEMLMGLTGSAPPRHPATGGAQLRGPTARVLVFDGGSDSDDDDDSDDDGAAASGDTEQSLAASGDSQGTTGTVLLWAAVELKAEEPSRPASGGGGAPPGAAALDLFAACEPCRGGGP